MFSSSREVNKKPVKHTCQLSRISKSEIACQTPVSRMFCNVLRARTFSEKKLRVKLFQIYKGCVIQSTKFALQTCITVKILKFGTPQTIAIIVLKIEKFHVTLH